MPLMRSSFSAYCTINGALMFGTEAVSAAAP
jgi:hypothetical protein